MNSRFGNARKQDPITKPEALLAITLRHGIWRVWFDGVFYGDYRSRQGAAEAAQDLRALLVAGGRRARIADEA